MALIPPQPASAASGAEENRECYILSQICTQIFMLTIIPPQPADVACDGEMNRECYLLSQIFDALSSGGGTAQPANQIVFGTGTSISSSPNFTYVESTDILQMLDLNGGTAFFIASDRGGGEANFILTADNLSSTGAFSQLNCDTSGKFDLTAYASATLKAELLLTPVAFNARPYGVQIGIDGSPKANFSSVSFDLLASNNADYGVRWYEHGVNGGTNYIGFLNPVSRTSNTSLAIRLPVDDPTAGQTMVFSAPVAGVSTASWASAGGGGWGTTGIVATLTGAASLELAANNFEIDNNSAAILRINISGAGPIVSLGDVDNQNNSTKFIIDDIAKSISCISQNGLLSSVIGGYPNGTGSDLYILGRKTSIGSVSSSNGTILVIDDPNGQFKFSDANGDYITINGSTASSPNSITLTATNGTGINVTPAITGLHVKNAADNGASLRIENQKNADEVFDVYALDGNPNGSLSAIIGSLAVDAVDRNLYINIDGGTTWSSFATTDLLNGYVLATDNSKFAVIQYVTPTTGSTVNSNGAPQLVIDPSGALLALTVTFPGSPADGQLFGIASTKAVTTLTLTGGTIDGGLASFAANGFGTWIFSANAGAWIRKG